MKIDFVITWVDGNDPEWRAEKVKYQQKRVDDRVVRYREWDNLRYWFRGVEKFAPWVNNIYFITCGHKPDWLNTDNPKLRMVKHSDYIPEQWLPTFSSRAIDMNLHRIESLEEHFVYFNDDMFITSPVSESFFFRKGLPCGTAILHALSPGHGLKKLGPLSSLVQSYDAPFFDLIPVNYSFEKRKTVLGHPGKWFSPRYGTQALRTLMLLPWKGFSGFMNFHLPYSYLKSTYSEVWEKFGDILVPSSEHKFRSATDLNHWVFDYWQYASGRFAPRSPKVGKLFTILDDDKNNEEICRAIKQQRYKVICVNDSYYGDAFEETRDLINGAFDAILPERSSFELY